MLNILFVFLLVYSFIQVAWVHYTKMNFPSASRGLTFCLCLLLLVRAGKRNISLDTTFLSWELSVNTTDTQLILHSKIHMKELSSVVWVVGLGGSTNCPPDFVRYIFVTSFIWEQFDLTCRGSYNFMSPWHLYISTGILLFRTSLFREMKNYNLNAVTVTFLII